MAAFVIYSFGDNSFKRYFDRIPDMNDDEVLIYTDDIEVQNNDVNFWHDKALARLSLSKLKKIKLAEIANKRYENETQGVEINGVTFDTDRESQARLTAVALQTLVEPKYSCRWKTSDGFIYLNAEQIMLVANTVRQHVQSCFDEEADLCRKINACDSFSDLDNFEWTEKYIYDGGYPDDDIVNWNFISKN